MIGRILLVGALFSLCVTDTAAQASIEKQLANIKTVQLYKAGDQLSLPLLQLGSTEQLELHFDDMEGGMKYYYYSLELCNADWSPVALQPYDYIRGFLTSRIYNYRQSSLTQIKYTHYQTLLPDRNTSITKAGNYLLRVFINDDTAKTVLARRVLVLNKKTSVVAQVLQPSNGNLYQTHQRVQVGVSAASSDLLVSSPAEIKVVVLQNNQWKTASYLNQPSIFRGNYFEYYDEEKTNYAAGKEWHWVDLRSFRIRSERVKKIVDSDTSSRVDIWVNPDGDRGRQIYLYYRDMNGLFTSENKDNPNPNWQSDYAWVHFTYVPPMQKPLRGKDLFVNGALTNYGAEESAKMIFNDSLGIYESTLFLKQGYYDYAYVSQPGNENIEGDYWGTENQYTILVYYKPFGKRYEELVGMSVVHSAFQR
jgi:hypothetical protein